MFPRLFFADDIFISYARKDSSTYAAGLADELTKHGFSCFIDRLGTEASDELPDSLRRKVRSCALMIVIGTKWSGTRAAIKEEITEFKKTRRPIIPVDIGSSLSDAIWYREVEGIAPEPEHNSQALDDGTPSPAVINRITKAFTYRRRNERLRRWTTMAAATLVFFVVASVVTGGMATRELRRAEQARADTERARGEAEQAKRDALAARADAEQARTEALAARDEATSARSVAAEQQRLADAATTEAQGQTRLAAAAAGRALEATANAKRQEGIAVGRQAAARADAHRAQSVQRDWGWVGLLEYSTFLSIEAARHLARAGVPPAEADQSLRASLDLLPRSVISFEREVEDMLLSTNGKYFITREGDFVRAWDTSDLTQLSDDVKLNGGEVTFNSDRNLMALIGKDKEVSLWELPKGHRRWVMGRVDEFSPAVADEFPALRFSPDGKYIAASVTRPGVGTDAWSPHRVVVWDAEAGELITEVEYKDELRGLALNPGGDLLALSLITPRQRAAGATESDNVVQLWMIKKQPILLYETRKTGDDGALYALAFSPDGKLLVLLRELLLGYTSSLTLFQQVLSGQ